MQSFSVLLLIMPILQIMQGRRRECIKMYKINQKTKERLQISEHRGMLNTWLNRLCVTCSRTREYESQIAPVGDTSQWHEKMHQWSERNQNSRDILINMTMRLNNLSKNICSEPLIAGIPDSEEWKYKNEHARNDEKRLIWEALEDYYNELSMSKSAISYLQKRIEEDEREARILAEMIKQRELRIQQGRATLKARKIKEA